MDENIAIDNILGPSNTTENNILFGAEAPPQTYYFLVESCFRVILKGTYGMSSRTETYNLLNWPHTAVIPSISTFGSAPITALGYNAIMSALNQTLATQIIDVSYSGRVSVSTSDASISVCGVTVPTNETTGKTYFSHTTAKINEFRCNTHLNNSSVTLHIATAVRRLNSETQTVPTNIRTMLASSATTVYFSEKPLLVSVVDSENSNYLLQGATITVANHSGLSSNVFFTGNKGYIRAYTSGNTGNSFNITVSRDGYRTISSTISIPSFNVNRISFNKINMTKTNYVVPNSNQLICSLLKRSPYNASGNACFSSSKYLTNFSLSAVTGSITTQTTFTGHQVLRYIDAKSFIPSLEAITDESFFGKEQYYTYNIPSLKTNNNWGSKVLVYTFSGLNSNSSYRIEMPETKTYVDSNLTGGLMACFYEFRCNGNTGPGLVNIIYDNFIITSQTQTFRNIIEIPFNFTALAPNQTYSVDMYFYIDALNNIQASGNISASALSGTYSIWKTNGNNNNVSPGGDVN